MRETYLKWTAPCLVAFAVSSLGCEDSLGVRYQDASEAPLADSSGTAGMPWASSALSARRDVWSPRPNAEEQPSMDDGGAENVGDTDLEGDAQVEDSGETAKKDEVVASAAMSDEAPQATSEDSSAGLESASASAAPVAGEADGEADGSLPAQALGADADAAAAGDTAVYSNGRRRRRGSPSTTEDGTASPVQGDAGGVTEVTGDDGSAAMEPTDATDTVDVEQSGAPAAPPTTGAADTGEGSADDAQNMESADNAAGDSAQEAAAADALDGADAVADAEVGVPSSPAGSGAAAAQSWWRPAVDSTWDWQLATPVDYQADYDVYVVDLEFNSAQTIQAIKTGGGAIADPAAYRRVICYVNVGALESFRADAKEFPAAILGDTYHGYPNERWLDVRKLDVLGPIMKARFEQAKAKGCDGIEPDNMDGYDTSAHEPTGFALTYQDQLSYNRWIAEQVHGLGMAVGMKNDLNQIKDLVVSFDFAISEECVSFDECGAFDVFVSQDKPVFLTEYEMALLDFCPTAAAHKFMGIRKDQELGTYREACPAW